VRSLRRTLGVLLLAALAAQAETVLILPFFNINSPKNNDWIGDSISETILETLASEGIRVVPPEVREEVLRDMNLRRYVRLTRASVMEIAINADADTVLYGEVESGAEKGTVRLSAWIYDVRHVRRRGSFTLSAPLEDLSSLQTTLAWQALSALKPGGKVTLEEFRQGHPPIRIDALENYVRALTASSPEQKHRLLANAARLEPAFSQPCFQLGRLNFFVTKNYRAAADWFAKVGANDFHYRESVFYLGLSRYQTGDFKGAVEAFRRAEQMVPLPEVLNNLGAALLRAGDSSAASYFERAIETDPADPDYHFNFGYALWRKGNFEAAAASLRAALERKDDDDGAALLLERCQKQSGPRPGDLNALERVKFEYNEAAWLTLKAMLGQEK